MIRVALCTNVLPKGFDEQWGGACATNYCLLKAFENDTEFMIDAASRDTLKTASDVKRFIDGADLFHLDCGDPLATCVFAEGIQPDIIGPQVRSPIKNYNGWICPYSKEWFYRSTVIRYNYAEERKNPELVTLFQPGVDTELLRPSDKPRRYIVWAGNSARYAKNYDMWVGIQKRYMPPPPHEYRTCVGYRVSDYWRLLGEAAVVVCTSRYESWCHAAFEAMACAVPVVWRHGLQGRWEDEGVRVDYTVDGFVDGIKLCLEESATLGLEARNKVEERHTLKHLRDSTAAIYCDVLERKQQHI